MQLDFDQRSRVAHLLAQLSPGTVESILSRFDPRTGRTIREELAAAPALESSQSALNEFAEFLYFLPHTDQTDNQVKIRGKTPLPTTLASDLISVETIMNLDNQSIDTLLASIAPELTVQMLCCSRESFIHRVLSRLSTKDAAMVVQRINESSSPGFAEMKSIQRRYCQIVTDLVAQGLIELNPVARQ